MPNWCENSLHVSGPEEEVCKWVEHAASWQGPGAEDQPLHFSAFVAPPSGLSDLRLIDWRVDHWGTKWEPDFYEMKRFEGRAVYRFDTPWAPPLAWIREVAQRWPRLQFELSYEEPGMDLSGRIGFENGQMICFEEDLFSDF